MSIVYLDVDSDLFTTTISPVIANVCQNQTLSSSEEIENRINVVVPYLVVLGTNFICKINILYPNDAIILFQESLETVCLY